MHACVWRMDGEICSGMVFTPLRPVCAPFHPFGFLPSPLLVFPCNRFFHAKEAGPPKDFRTGPAFLQVRFPRSPAALVAAALAFIRLAVAAGLLGRNLDVHQGAVAVHGMVLAALDAAMNALVILMRHSRNPPCALSPSHRRIISMALFAACHTGKFMIQFSCLRLFSQCL